MNNKYSDDYLVNYCVKEMLYKSLTKSFKRYGIEGTEKKIKELFEGKQKDLMLNGYNELVFGKRG